MNILKTYNGRVPACGVFCGGCPTYTRDKNPCPGAEINIQRCEKCKTFHLCCKDKGVKHCYECSSFSCAKFKSFAKRWLKYGQDFLENQKLLQSQGAELFLVYYNLQVENQKLDIMRQIPLVDKDYLLIKTEGKGGWTFAEISDIPMPKTSFGMLKVKGKIDDYEFSNVHLMPIGNGHVGLALKAEIRKIIKKQAGDTVHIILYVDKMPTEIPEELILCMKYEDGVFEKFEAYSDGEKKGFVNWIYSAKMEQTKVDRIAKTIRMVQNGEKFYNWEK